MGTGAHRRAGRISAKFVVIALVGATCVVFLALPFWPTAPTSSSRSPVSPSLSSDAVHASISDIDPTLLSVGSGALAHLDDQEPATSLGPRLTDTADAPRQTKKPTFRKTTVFFATDRAKIDPYSFLLWSRLTIPTGIGMLVILGMLVGVWRGRQKVVWAVGASIAILSTLSIGYEAALYAAQTMRLASSGSTLFSSQRKEESARAYPLHLGSCTITIPTHHRPGRIERPSIIQLDLAEDPRKHVTIAKVESLDQDAFFQDVQKNIHSSTTKSAFLFVHGFNVQFEDALRRTAQISTDLGFDGTALLYSWPSHGSLVHYSQDETNASWSVSHLEQFLRDLHAKTGVQRLHLIAHSMGNRVLLGALEQVSLKLANQQPMFGQIVLAAPDVDAGEFRTRFAGPVIRTARHTTLYTSASDRALMASMKLHGNTRLGIGGPLVQHYPGIDTIDVSPVDTSLLGHSYYGSHPLLIQDLRALVELGEPASMRQWLSRWLTSTGSEAWRFRPELASQARIPWR